MRDYWQRKEQERRTANKTRAVDCVSMSPWSGLNLNVHDETLLGTTARLSLMEHQKALISDVLEAMCVRDIFVDTLARSRHGDLITTKFPVRLYDDLV